MNTNTNYSSHTLKLKKFILYLKIHFFTWEAVALWTVVDRVHIISNKALNLKTIYNYHNNSNN